MYTRCDWCEEFVHISKMVEKDGFYICKPCLS